MVSRKIIIGVCIVSLLAISIATLKPECGNGKCEFFESEISCCIDCGCFVGYACIDNKCVKEVCGDGICSGNENCESCPEDCKCKDSYCFKGKCVKPICGNGVCEPNEAKNCCIDCGCGVNEACVNNTCIKLKCGDGVCKTPENCWNCPEDCRCEEGEYCSEDGNCVKPICGNGVCEPFETCCEDCGCAPNQYCNRTTHRCEYYKLKVSDDIIAKVAREYLEKKKFDYTSIKVEELPSKIGEKLGKRVFVYKNGVLVLELFVDENLNITEAHII